SAFGINAYAEQPRRTGAYIEDQVQLGRVELMAGARLDRFDSRASYPVVPGRISSITDPIAVSGTDTFRLAPFDPTNPTANFQPASAHTTVSPQLRMRVDAWPGGTVRFTAGRQARIPGFESLFAFKNTDVFPIFRFSTNRHYTLQRNSGAGLTIDQDADPIEPENSSTLAVFKTLDIRITRSFPMGRVGGAVFVESTNLFNWTNLTDIFTETGEVTNDLHRARWVDEQVAQLEAEASQNGLRVTLPGTGEPAVDLRSPGVCTGWSSRTGNGAGGPADC